MPRSKVLQVMTFEDLLQSQIIDLPHITTTLVLYHPEDKCGWQGNWEFAERARQSIQLEEGSTAARAAPVGMSKQTKTQGSLNKPLSHSALVEVSC